MKRETFSINSLAANLRIDRRTLTKRLEGIEPGEGGYYLDDVFRAVAQAPQASELEDARTQLAREQVARLARERAVAEGELGYIRDLAKANASQLAIVVTRLNSIPDAAAQRFDANVARAVRTIVRELIDATVTDLRANLENSGRGERRGSAPAPAAHGKRVGRRESKALD